MSRLQSLVLILHRRVFFREGLDTVPEVTAFFLQLQHLGFQPFIFLSHFGVLATHQWQAQ